MTRSFLPPPPEVVAALRAESERLLTRDEWEAFQRIATTDEELSETRALIEWFTRRYPTPAERLAYARRAYARWARSFPKSSSTRT